MEYRQLGTSGLRVSTLTMGTMTFGGSRGFAAVGSTDLHVQQAGLGEVGVVAQNYPLFEHRTVLSNLMLAATRKSGSDQKEAHERVVAFLNDFEFDRLLHGHTCFGCACLTTTSSI